MGSAAGYIIAKQNQIVRRFHEAGALSAETAVDLAQAGCRDTRVFQRMVRRGIFKPVDQGKYYLDIPAWLEFRRGRRERALQALLVILFIVVVIFLFVKK